MTRSGNAMVEGAGLAAGCGLGTFGIIGIILIFCFSVLLLGCGGCLYFASQVESEKQRTGTQMDTNQKTRPSTK